jgi:hypothetical protein
MYHKRIVVDFDDTLAFHQNRNFDDALPNVPLINKLNNLYDQGWQIDIFTARGSISCASREEAFDKYYESMWKWLDNNNVKYNELSFEKPLAAYYIDDKGILPEDFLKVNIRDLEGGLSGGEIYTDGKLVHKQDTNAHATGDWFSKAKGIATPNVHRIVGETITMDYVEHDEGYFDDNFHMGLALIQNKLEAMKVLKPLDNLTYESYIDRIEVHANNSGQEVLIDNVRDMRLLNEVRTYDRTFAHGDFGIKNMLFDGKEDNMTLIDPITGVFGCTEIDCAKLIASLVINDYAANVYKATFEYLALFNEINKDILLVLVIAEITRVYKYHPDKNYIMECVKNVCGHF